jgi:hypothetical protein
MFRKWCPDEMIAVRELYSITASSPRGDKKNVLILALARAFGRTPAAVFKRLYNYASHNPADPHRGLGNGGEIAKRFWMFPKEHPREYALAVRRIRKDYRLAGVI